MIAATSTMELVTRMLVSLGAVLAIVAVAYLVARRRSGGVAPVAGRADRTRFGRRRSAPLAIEVVGRVGLTRSTTVVAVRFGDRVVLVAASEQGHSNVISEMPARDWDELHTIREPIAPTTPADGPVNPIVGARPNFIEALRQATARHG